MATRKPPSKKKLTLDDFAALVHKDLTRITTLTDDVVLIKDGLTGLANELGNVRRHMATREELKEIRDDVKRITDFMVSKADLASTLREEIDGSEYAREVSELRARVERLEEKLGSGRTRRAA